MRGLLRPTQFVTTLSAFLFPTSTVRTIRFASSFAILGSHQAPFLSRSAPSFSCPFVRAEVDGYFSPLGKQQQQQQQQQQRRFLAMSTNDEQAKAQTAVPEDVTIFDKIVAGDIPCTEVYSDDKVLAFRDVNPTAPVHILVIPKDRDGMTQVTKARPDQKELLGHLMYVAQELGAKECPNGFRIVINDGKDGGQSVYHLHLHVIGGRPMKWPPG